MALRYDTKTWENRPTMTTWENLKPYVGFQPGISDTSLPPIFGWCIDQLRVKHEIYVAVTPHLETVSKGDTIGSDLVFHFTGTITKMKNGEIIKSIKYTGNNFVPVMNASLSLAAEYLNSEK